MDQRLHHTARLIAYRKTNRKSGLQEIAVYEDGMIKKIDLACKGHYAEWVHPDVEHFIRCNRKLERVT